MTILGIETSCDDTSIAVIKAKENSGGDSETTFNILSNIVSSQTEIHRKWGGVYPTLAKREHQKNLNPVLEKALKEADLLNSNNELKITEEKDAKLKKILNREKVLYENLKKFLKKYENPKIDLIAVTVGPGLEPSLWQGVNFGKALSFCWSRPLIPVNHLEAHIFSNWISLKDKVTMDTIFPAIYLIVSGGHTQLILVEKMGNYKLLGETRDDAAGECFDKTARILGLNYPGGPEIEKKASKFKDQDSFNIKLPRPMLKTNNYDFSFSGLKTAVLYDYKERKEKIKSSEAYIREMAKEIQQSIVDVLTEKTINAAKEFNVKSVMIGGGVSANKKLREQMNEKIGKELPKVNYATPDISLSTDNASMVAAAGYFNWKEEKTSKWSDIEAQANLKL